LFATFVVLTLTADKDGMAPYDALIVGPSGNLYGTTSGGGLKMGGTVFEIVP
jgi:uncharacterized repeat protein (TIGR03803 family)